jgi:DNA excision repair protein ERCC-5
VTFSSKDVRVWIISHKLFRGLLESSGRRISIETLEGRILAIDASIWLTQFIKAMRDQESGSVRPAAHLIGFFRRLCKLRFNGIRPVLVFDGATPEIKLREIKERRKRREQFAFRGANSNDAFQRMAKRLLADNLKKRKLSKLISPKEAEERINKDDDPNESSKLSKTTPRSYSAAPGFYDPTLAAASQQEIESKSNRQEESSKIEEKYQTTTQQESSQDIIEILENENYLEDSNPIEQQQSDWDTVVLDTTILNPTRTTITSDVKPFVSASENDFDADYVSSLPSAQRKDWVEDARRKRRMLSRRDFMKVAYNEASFSNCQLKNFLKSSKLNQDIHKMATKVTQNDDGMGEALASDRTKRIIFEKDSEKQFSKKKQKDELLKEYRKQKLSLLASDSDDDSEEINWKIVGSKHKVGSTTNVRAIMDDSDSDEESHGEGCGFFGSNSTEYTSNHQIHDNNRNDNVSSDTSLSQGKSRNRQKPDDEVKLVKISKPGKSDKDAKFAQELQDQSIAIAIQNAEYSDDKGATFFSNTSSDEEGGGFLQTKNSEAGIETNTTLNENGWEKNLTANQDRNLALALQNAEYLSENEDTKSAGDIMQVKDPESPQESESCPSNIWKGNGFRTREFNSNSDPSVQIYDKRISMKKDSAFDYSDEGDKIEWEEGSYDKSNPSVHVYDGPISAMQGRASCDTSDEDERIELEGGGLIEKHYNESVSTRKFKAGENDSSDEENRIEWEEGADDIAVFDDGCKIDVDPSSQIKGISSKTIQSRPSEDDKTSTENKTSKSIVFNKVQVVDEYVEDDISVEWEDADNSGFQYNGNVNNVNVNDSCNVESRNSSKEDESYGLSFGDNSDPWNDEFGRIDSSSNEMVEALTHAQDTASRL